MDNPVSFLGVAGVSRCWVADDRELLASIAERDEQREAGRHAVPEVDQAGTWREDELQR